MALLIRVLAVALAASAPACELSQGTDPLALDGDRIVILALAEADSSTVMVIVGYPHIAAGVGPTMTVRGAAGGADVVGTLDACDPAISEVGGVYSCYRVMFPRALMPGDTMALVAENSDSRLAGRTVIPQRPDVIEPSADTVLARDSIGIVTLPVFLSAPDAGAVLPVVGVPHVAVDGQIRTDCRFTTTRFNGTLIDTIRIGAMFCPPRGVPEWDEIAVEIRWLASDSAYANYFRFAEGEILRLPWPGLGMTEGIGMVGSRSASRPLRVVVRR